MPTFWILLCAFCKSKKQADLVKWEVADEWGLHDPDALRVKKTPMAGWVVHIDTNREKATHKELDEMRKYAEDYRRKLETKKKKKPRRAWPY